MESHNILYDLLTAAGVKATPWYTARRLRDLSFRSLFGIASELKACGVESAGVSLGNVAADLPKLPLPFVAKTPKGLVIVTAVEPGRVTYLSQGTREQATPAELARAMSPDVLVVWPGPNAEEPQYASHKFTEVANRAKKWVLLGLAALIFTWLFIVNGICNHVTTILIAAIDIAGIYISSLLVAKSAHIKSRHADAVCAVVEAGGCDDVLDMDASKFFGIFGWSEVGFAYFSVSLVCLMIFPQYIGYLAAINVICLPFSFWSVWYQKYRAKTWCTLCLCVQTMLWLLFACYLTGGWLRFVFPIRIEFFVLAASYVVVMLGVNALMPLIDRNNR